MERQLSPGSIATAVGALRFFYTVTLKKNWKVEEVIPAPKIPNTLPVILSPEEVMRFLESMKNVKHRTVLTTCYAAGLRISEAIHLKPVDIDSKRMVIRVEQGKVRKPLRDAFSPAVGDTATLVAHRKTSALVISRYQRGHTDHPAGRFESLSAGRRPVWYFQTHHAAFVPACLCCAYARKWNRRPHDSVTDGPYGAC